uniref:Uncharacterized protein n=1 Tax=Glossina austeni TaxID=7395 RepID=A0A1A9UL65_GLOAU
MAGLCPKSLANALGAENRVKKFLVCCAIQVSQIFPNKDFKLWVNWIELNYDHTRTGRDKARAANAACSTFSGPKDAKGYEIMRILSSKTNMQGVRTYRHLFSVKTIYSSKNVGGAASNTQALSVMGISWFHGELLLLLLVVVVVAAVVTGAFVLIFDVVECTLGAIIELVEWLVVVLVALRIGVGEAGLAFKLRNAAGGGQDTLVIVIFGVECIKRAAALLGAGLPFINLVLTVLLRKVFCKNPLTFCNSDSLRFAMLLIKARAVEELTY